MVNLKLKKIIPEGFLPLLILTISSHSYGGDPVDLNTTLTGNSLEILRLPKHPDNQHLQPELNPWTILTSDESGVNAFSSGVDGFFDWLWAVQNNPPDPFWDFINDDPPSLYATHQQSFFIGVETLFSKVNSLGSSDYNPRMRFLFQVHASSIHDGRDIIILEDGRIQGASITLSIDSFKMLKHNIPSHQFEIGANKFRFLNVTLLDISETAQVTTPQQSANFNSGKYFTQIPSSFARSFPDQGGVGSVSDSNPTEFRNVSYNRRFTLVYRIAFAKEAWHGAQTEVSSTFNVDFNLNTSF